MSTHSQVFYAPAAYTPGGITTPQVVPNTGPVRNNINPPNTSTLEYALGYARFSTAYGVCGTPPYVQRPCTIDQLHPFVRP